jgi:hypothetical protein
MKRNFLAFMLCLSFISTCGPSAGAIATQTATAATAVAASWTRTPTPTFTPTSTLTATFTPSPTPLGSGGRLLFFRNSSLYSFDITNQQEEIVLSQEQLIGALELEGIFSGGVSGYTSPDGKKALIQACGDENCTESNFKSALVTTNLSLTKRFELGFGYHTSAVQWSPDSQKVLIQFFRGNIITDGFITHIIDGSDANFGERIRLELAFYAFFSPDGSQVYYSTLGGYKVINSDGSNKQALNCEVCENPVSNAGAVSPDSLKVVVPLNSGGKTIQILYPDGNTGFNTTSEYSIVIADRDFSASQVVASGINSLSTMNSILWSADSEMILFSVTEYNPDSPIIKQEEASEVIKAVEINSGKISTLIVPEEASSVFLCGWSPDHRLISYITHGFDFYGRIIVQDVEGGKPTLLTPLESGIGSCPVWLSSE